MLLSFLFYKISVYGIISLAVTYSYEIDKLGYASSAILIFNLIGVFLSNVVYILFFKHRNHRTDVFMLSIPMILSFLLLFISLNKHYLITLFLSLLIGTLDNILESKFFVISDILVNKNKANSISYFSNYVNVLQAGIVIAPVFLSIIIFYKIHIFYIFLFFLFAYIIHLFLFYNANYVHEINSENNDLKKQFLHKLTIGIDIIINDSNLIKLILFRILTNLSISFMLNLIPIFLAQKSFSFFDFVISQNLFNSFYGIFFILSGLWLAKIFKNHSEYMIQIITILFITFNLISIYFIFTGNNILNIILLSAILGVNLFILRLSIIDIGRAITPKKYLIDVVLTSNLIVRSVTILGITISLLIVENSYLNSLLIFFIASLAPFLLIAPYNKRIKLS